ncbi:beta-lactamase related protein [Anaeramoeba flamelloides]|uniref:Beta-lactamase related protein n=1 Tax=Anaeramoeba flamelloides TaxID=1746091 RepID=A0ABQ8YFF7_9EUKA|nr:beta-lactamase related protein [Anaeramoeba flamelloides]
MPEQERRSKSTSGLRHTFGMPKGCTCTQLFTSLPTGQMKITMGVTNLPSSSAYPKPENSSFDSTDSRIQSLGPRIRLIKRHTPLDHSSGTWGFLKHCSNTVLLCTQGAEAWLIHTTNGIRCEVYELDRQCAKLYGPVTKISEKYVRLAMERDHRVWGQKATIPYTLGHAKHHVCIHDLHQLAFSGDNFGIRLPTLHKQKHDRQNCLANIDTDRL